MYTLCCMPVMLAMLIGFVNRKTTQIHYKITFCCRWTHLTFGYAIRSMCKFNVFWTLYINIIRWHQTSHVWRDGGIYYYTINSTTISYLVCLLSPIHICMQMIKIKFIILKSLPSYKQLNFSCHLICMRKALTIIKRKS